MAVARESFSSRLVSLSKLIPISNKARLRSRRPGPRVFLPLALLAAWALPAQVNEQSPEDTRPSSFELGTPSGCDADSRSAFSRQALSAETRGDNAAAAKLFRAAWSACPGNPLLLIKAAQALHREKEYGQAAEAAREALLHDPKNVQGLTTLANALLMAQRLEEAKNAAARLVEVKPNESAGLLLLANIDYLLGDSTEAEQLFLKVLDNEPANEDAAYMLGRVYYMENRVDYAMAQFQRALKVNPKSYKAWDNLALCYDAKGEYEKAIGAFLEAIKIVEKGFPEYDWPYANLADLLLRRNEFQQAYQAATMAAKRNPFSARNFYLGGKALWRLDRTEDALKWLERSSGLDPDYPEPLYLLGQVYAKSGDREKAKDMLERFRVAKEKAPKTRR